MTNTILLLTFLAWNLFVLVSVVIWTVKNGIGPTPTSPKVKKLLLQTIPCTINGKIYELGSGFGTLAIALAKKFPHSQVHAYETSLIPYLASSILSKTLKVNNLQIHRKDFYTIPLNDASLIVCYLYPRAMAKLEPKFEKELKPGTLIASHTFALPHAKPLIVSQANDIYHTKIYLYKI